MERYLLRLVMLLSIIHYSSGGVCFLFVIVVFVVFLSNIKRKTLLWVFLMHSGCNVCMSCFNGIILLLLLLLLLLSFNLFMLSFKGVGLPSALTVLRECRRGK